MYYTQLAKMSLDKILELTAAVVCLFFFYTYGSIFTHYDVSSAPSILSSLKACVRPDSYAVRKYSKRQVHGQLSRSIYYCSIYYSTTTAGMYGTKHKKVEVGEWVGILIVFRALDFRNALFCLKKV